MRLGVVRMTETDSRNLLSAAPVSAAALIGAAASPGRPRELSRAALAAAAEPTRPAYSPIVVAGFVRLIDCALVFVSGVIAYCAYLMPTIPLDWDYAAAILGVAALSVFVFQAADVYQIHAFQRPVSQLPRLLSAWSVVFLIATTVSFFAKLDVTLSRVWLVSFYARSASSRCSCGASASTGS